MNFILQLSCTNMLVCSRGFSAVIAACERECRERHRNKQRKAFARKCAPAQRRPKMMGFRFFSDLFAYLLMHGLQIEMIKGVISTAPHCCEFVPGLKAAKSQEEEQQKWHGLFESKYIDRVELSASNRCYKAFCHVRNCTASLVFFSKQLLDLAVWTSLFTFKLIISSYILVMFYLILPVLKPFQGGLPPFQVHVMEQLLFARYHRSSVKINRNSSHSFSECLQIQYDVWKDSKPEHLDITANSTQAMLFENDWD